MRTLFGLLLILTAPAFLADGAMAQSEPEPRPIVLNAAWTNLGAPFSSPILMLSLEKRFKEAGFVFTDNADVADADVQLIIESRKGAEMLGISSAFAELVVRMTTDKGRVTLYSGGFDRERGLQLSFEEAGRLAVEMALSRFVEKLLPEMKVVADAYFGASVSDSFGTVDTPASDQTPPKIVVLDPPRTRGIGVRQKLNKYTIRGRVVDEGAVKEIMVNGRAATRGDGGAFSAEVVLRSGPNEIVITATDAVGNQSEERFDMDRTAPMASSGGSQFRALIIGIDSYGGPWAPLENASHDAHGVAEMLAARYGFRDIRTLYNEEANRVNILRELEALTLEAGPNDHVLIYYAGHGDLKERMRRGYWVPADARSRSLIDFIPNSVLQDILRGMPAQHTLLIADACFAGDVFRGVQDEPVRAGAAGTEADDRVSRKALTSGSVEPVMDGGADGHSLFTYQLLKVLGENQAAKLDVKDIFETIKDPILENSPQTPLFKTVGDTGDEGGVFYFMLGGG